MNSTLVSSEHASGAQDTEKTGLAGDSREFGGAPQTAAHRSPPLDSNQTEQSRPQIPCAAQNRTAADSQVSGANSEGKAATLDQRAIENIRFLESGGAPGILRMLIEQFFEDACKLINELQRASQEGNMDTIQRAAHSFKSASATLGATVLSELCREMELGTRAAKLENGGELTARIECEYQRTQRALLKVLSEPDC